MKMSSPLIQQLRRVVPLCAQPLQHSYCTGGQSITESSSSYPPPPSPASTWHLFSGLCLERPAVIAPPMTELELKVSQLLKQLEFERSLKSDHEIRHIADLAAAEALKLSDGDDADLLESASLQTAADFEDACVEEAAAFTGASTVTDADRKGDLTSPQRHLAYPLVLLVKQKLSAESAPRWMLPHGRHMPGESLRQTAERSVRTLLGEKVQARFLGSAPWGFYSYKYPQPVRQQTGATGAKVFFYKAYLDSGSVQPMPLSADGQITEFRWLRRSEMPELLLKRYHRAVSDFLISDQ